VSQPDPDDGFTRVHPLSPFLRGGLLVVALGVAAGRQLLDGGDIAWPWWAVLLVVAGSLAVGAVSWWFTRYRVGADELRIDSGVLVRRSRRIRLDRIQAIEVQQPFLARIFGMAALAIETAGGAGSEATLAYLPLRRAGELRHHLLVEAGREDGAHETDARLPGGMRPGDELLHRVDPGLLLASQLLRTGPLMAALGAAAATLVGTALGEPLSLAVLLPAAIGVGSAVLSGFLGNYGFVLRQSTQGLSARAGAFSVRSAALPVQRIRGLVLREPLVWRWIGWASVDVTVAGVVVRDDEDKRLSTTLVPVARRAVAERLVTRVLPGLDLGGLAFGSSPRAARWIDPVAWRVLGLAGDDAYVVTRRGLVNRRTDVAPRVAVQSRGLRQGPVQRRLGLATVGLHLPSGPAAPVAVHRAAAEAWQLTLAVGAPVQTVATDGAPVPGSVGQRPAG